MSKQNDTSFIKMFLHKTKKKRISTEPEIRINNSSGSDEETEIFNCSIKVSSNKRFPLPGTSKNKQSVGNIRKRKRDSLPIEISQSKRTLTTKNLMADRTRIEFSDNDPKESNSLPLPSARETNKQGDTLNRNRSTVTPGNVNGINCAKDVADDDDDDTPIKIENNSSDSEDDFPDPFVIDKNSSSNETKSSSFSFPKFQAASNSNSPFHFNIHADAKYNDLQVIQDLNAALTSSFMENLCWNSDVEPTNSQRKAITVAHTEVRFGSLMVFFTTENQKCLLFIDTDEKIVSKIREGVELIFCHDYPPYQSEENDGSYVNIFVGISKIKLKDQ